MQADQGTGIAFRFKTLFMRNDIIAGEKPVVNLTEKERMISGITGGLLLTLGILGFGKSSFRRAVRMSAGSWLIFRGLTGYCPVTALKETAVKESDEKMAPVNS
jgi:uncharacterized membrane protein